MLRTSVTVPDLNTVVRGQLGDIADMASAAMRDAASGVKQEWRGQVLSAGLGAALGNTIRANTYPKSRGSVNPAAYVYTKAPKIIDAFSRGATIRPVNGARYLWIPSKNVPRRPGKGNRRLSPEQVERQFGAQLFVEKSKSGQLFAFLPAARSQPISLSKRKQASRRLKNILMFTLVRTVRMPKKIDLDQIAADGAAEFVRGFTARLGN